MDRDRLTLLLVAKVTCEAQLLGFRDRSVPVFKALPAPVASEVSKIEAEDSFVQAKLRLNSVAGYFPDSARSNNPTTRQACNRVVDSLSNGVQAADPNIQAILLSIDLNNGWARTLVQVLIELKVREGVLAVFKRHAWVSEQPPGNQRDLELASLRGWLNPSYFNGRDARFSEALPYAAELAAVAHRSPPNTFLGTYEADAFIRIGTRDTLDEVIRYLATAPTGARAETLIRLVEELSTDARLDFSALRSALGAVSNEGGRTVPASEQTPLNLAIDTADEYAMSQLLAHGALATHGAPLYELMATARKIMPIHDCPIQPEGCKSYQDAPWVNRMVTTLIAHGAKVDEVGANEMTPFVDLVTRQFTYAVPTPRGNRAYQAAHESLMLALLNAGAEVNAKVHSCTALDITLELSSRQRSVTDFMHSQMDFLNNHGGKTSLSCAVSKEFDRFFRTLLPCLVCSH